MSANEDLRRLYDALDERDRHIDQLEEEFTQLEKDADKQEDELIAYRDKIAELRVVVKELRVDNDTHQQERLRLEEQTNTYKSQLDTQRNTLATAAQTADDAKKFQRDSKQQIHRVEIENQRLITTIFEIEENEDILVNEIDTLAAEKTHYQSETEELAAKCDLLYADIDEKARLHSQYLHEKETAENTLAAKSEQYQRELDNYQQKDEASKLEIARLLNELEQSRAKEREYAYVKQNESFKRELIHVRRENTNLHKLYDHCLQDKNHAEEDLDGAIQALNHTKRKSKEESASAVRKERVAATEANVRLERVTVKLEGAAKRCHDAKGQLNELRAQLEQSESRNAEYYEKHGLTDAIRHQKQLEADIRRRDHDLKCVTHKLGVEMDKNRCLSKACEWLQQKADVGQVNDEEIKQALVREDSILQSTNAELTRQIEAIEDERLKLLAQLREQAIDIGDKGVRFLGMSSQQVSQVMEFATNLRQGIVALPLNDLSKELQAEISSLKAEKEVARVAISRLERELSTKESPRESEGKILKQVLDNLSAENTKLRDEIASKSGTTTNVESIASALTPLMRQRAKEVLGQDLASMSAAADVQFMCLINEYDTTKQELSLLKKSMAKISDNTYNSKADDRWDTIVDTRDGQTPAGSNEELVSKAAEELRLEKEAISTQLKQLVEDATKSSQLELVSEEVSKLTAKLKLVEDKLNKELRPSVVVQQDTSANLKSINESLVRTQQNLADYKDELQYLQQSANRMNSEKVALQISCLNDLIKDKTRIINETRQKLSTAKQTILKLSRDSGRGAVQERKSDRSVSTNSIDRAIFMVANNSGYDTPTRNNLHQHLDEASRLVFEKEHVISEQNVVIAELKTKLAQAEESQKKLAKEAESMKADISTLVAKASEAEAAVSGVTEIESLLDKSKKEVNDLKSKIGRFNKDRTATDAKMKELESQVARTKRVLSVTKQGRSRSEQNVKTANEEISSLKADLHKMETLHASLKKEKIDAQNEKLQATRRARLSQSKLKDLTDLCNQKQNSKTVDELEKRVNVLNKTVSGLASTNSKLRGELASFKLLKQRADDEAVVSPQIARNSFSRERPTSSRANALEHQVNRLHKSLQEEKTAVSNSATQLERYQRRITSLEKSLQRSNTPTPTNIGEDANNSALHEQLSSLANENKTLQRRLTDLNNSDSGTIGAEVRQLKSENENLKKENGRLSKIDHLDFFEEIEDLKLKYNEAVRQINQMTTS